MTPEEARRRFTSSRVARMATIDPFGLPHLVPIVFALERDTIYSAVDHKPKRTTALRRLANVAANPGVAVLVDEYTEEWDRLWWARADGTATVHEGGSPAGAHGIALLTKRYTQYAPRPPGGPVIAVAVRDGPAGSPTRAPGTNGSQRAFASPQLALCRTSRSSRAGGGSRCASSHATPSNEAAEPVESLHGAARRVRGVDRSAHRRVERDRSRGGGRSRVLGTRGLRRVRPGVERGTPRALLVTRRDFSRLAGRRPPSACEEGAHDERGHRAAEPSVTGLPL